MTKKQAMLFTGADDMVLKIDSTVYGYTDKISDTESVAYIFDPDSFLIVEKGSNEADTVAEPLIFPSVTRSETQRAYVKSFDDKKLDHIFSDLDDKEYWDTFWNIFDDGGEKLIAFEKFERRYRIQKITEWCDENNIPYYIDKKDDFINWILEM